MNIDWREHWEHYRDIWTHPVYFHLVILFLYLAMGHLGMWKPIMTLWSYLIEISFVLMGYLAVRFIFVDKIKSAKFLGVAMFFLFALSFIVFQITPY